MDMVMEIVLRLILFCIGCVGILFLAFCVQVVKWIYQDFRTGQILDLIADTVCLWCMILGRPSVSL